MTNQSIHFKIPPTGERPHANCPRGSGGGGLGACGMLSLAMLSLLAASPSVYPSPDSNPDSGLDDDWYPDYTYGDAQQQALQAVECTEVTCKAEWRADGECDRMCNTPACEWDDGDCFHDDDGCYTHPTAADYRGNVSQGKNGVPCQYWDSQWPNTH
eukprot:499696-Prymnesium_polylepis.2